MVNTKRFWFKTACLVLVLSLAMPMLAFADPSAADIDYNRAACYTAAEGNIARLPSVLQLTNATETRYNPLTGAGIERTGINANFCNDSYGVPSVQVLRLNNGLRPASGTTNGYLSWSYTDTFGVNNRLYFVLNWGEPYTIDAVRCDWWTDSNVTVPNSEARVEWLDGTVWKEVTNMRNPLTGAAVTNIGTLAMGNWNPVTFDPVTTTQLRLRLHRTGTITNGIGVGEWEVFGAAAEPGVCPDCGEDPCVCIPDEVMTQREFIKSLLLEAGMKEHQFANGPSGNEFFNYNEMAKVAGFFENWTYEPTKELSQTEKQQMALATLPAFNGLRDAISADPPAPYFVNGMAVPIFPYGNSPTAKYNDTTGDGIARYVVYIDTNYDSDGDGKLDLIKVLVQLPRAAVEKGMKVPTIYEARPYVEGTNGSVHTTAALRTRGDQWLAENGPFTHEMLHGTAPARVPTGEVSTKEMVQNADYRDWYYTYTYNQTNTSASVSYTGTGQNAYENLNWYDYYLVRGFAFVTSAGLAALNSEGICTYGVDIEIDAFKCVIEWLTGDRKAYSDKAGTMEVKADWSNGNVGMTGRSYAGGTQFALATTGVKGLKAIVPVAGTSSYYDYQNSQGSSTGGNSYTQGMAWYINSRLGAPNWSTVYGRQAGYIQQMLAEATALNGNYGDHWARREYTVNGWFKDWGPEKIQAPMLIVHGVNDDNVRTKQSLNMYNAAKEAGVPVKMLWNQGDHMTPTFPLANPTTAEATTGTMRPHGMYVGIFDLYGKKVPLQYDDVLNLWFSHFLYGADNKVLDVLPNVIAQDNYITPVDTGANVWVHYDSWEPFTTRLLTAKYNVPRAASPISMAGFNMGLIAPEHVEVDAIPPDSEALGEGAGNAVPVAAVIDAAEVPVALAAAAADEPDLVTLSSASAATLSLANLRTPTAGSLVYAVDLPQDFTVIGAVKVNIRAAFKTVGSTTPTDNLRMHVTLAEIPLTANTLRYYGASNVGTAPGRTMVQQRGAYMGSGVANINLVRFTQITNGSYRQICKGWFDLCNPKAGFEAYTSDAKDSILPRNSIGVFYDYTLYLQPTIHSAKAGNKLVALITFGGSGASGGASPASTTGNAAYTIDVDLNGTYVSLPSAYSADQVGEPSFTEPEPAAITFDYQLAGVENTVVQTAINSEFGALPVPPSAPGLKFLGWFTAKQGGEEVTAATIVTQAEVTVYAQYAYEVTFLGWDGAVLSRQDVLYGEAAVAPSAPERAGHTFTGWSAPFANVTAPVTAIALYAINHYEVTFVDWDGKVISAQTVAHGADATAPADPARDGYTFTGWSAAFANITAPLTVTAQYEINYYGVTFVDWDSSVISEQAVAHGDGAVAPADPVRKDWRFSGWDKDFSKVVEEMVVTATYAPLVVRLTPSAAVTKLTGNQNDLAITLLEAWSDGYVKTYNATLKINNNAAGTYAVGPYRVYVDTKGNVQIRECYVVNPPALPFMGVR